MEVILRSPTGDVKVLQSTLAGVPAQSARATFVRTVAANLGQLPAPLALTWLKLICGEPIPANAREIAHATTLSRRTLDRKMTVCGVRSTGTMIEAVKALRAWEMRALDPISREREATRLGFGSLRASSERFQAVLGASLRVASSRLSEENVGRLLAEHVLAHAQREDEA
jgi:hypothetical protein